MEQTTFRTTSSTYICMFKQTLPPVHRFRGRFGDQGSQPSALTERCKALQSNHFREVSQPKEQLKAGMLWKETQSFIQTSRRVSGGSPEHPLFCFWESWLVLFTTVFTQTKLLWIISQLSQVIPSGTVHFLSLRHLGSVELASR